jgi:hypothetical protein
MMSRAAGSGDSHPEKRSDLARVRINSVSGEAPNSLSELTRSPRAEGDHNPAPPTLSTALRSAGAGW